MSFIVEAKQFDNDTNEPLPFEDWYNFADEDEPFETREDAEGFLAESEAWAKRMLESTYLEFRIVEVEGPEVDYKAELEKMLEEKQEILEYHKLVRSQSFGKHDATQFALSSVWVTVLEADIKKLEEILGR